MTAATRLSLHMARLAQADQVRPLVRFLCGGELAEWPGVIDRQTGTDELAAVGAMPALLNDYDHADLSPASPAVSLGASYPERGVWSRLVQPAIGVPARLGAVKATELRAAHAMRLGLKGGTAGHARQGDRCDITRIRRSDHDGRLGVLLRGTPDGVHHRDAMNARAALRAEPATSALAVARQCGDGRSARLAWRHHALNLCCHLPILPERPFGGTGTTALVASVHGRDAVTVDMSADYCRLAAWRTSDPGERCRALGVPKPPPVSDGQGDLFEAVS